MRILMVTPDYFDIEYAINPHMLGPDGTLKRVDRDLAKRQWLMLKNIYEKLGIEVITLSGRPGLPDMVFCANQTFLFRDSKGTPTALLSNMKAAERRAEVPFFKNLFESLEYNILRLKTDSIFEGSGDLIWDYESKRVFSGYGFRSSLEAIRESQNIIPNPLIPLELVNEKFYHLDTCLSVINGQTAIFVPEAFTEQSIQELSQSFKTLIEIPLEEAERGFAGNAFCPDQRNVILQKGNPTICRKLKKFGFFVHEVDTSEFINAGGSVFCMKQVLI